MEIMESPNQSSTIMDNSLIPLSHAVQIIKTAILQSQEQSAKKVNADLLALYYAIGGYISKESRRQQWGSGAILAISEQLQKELPGLKGFGETSIKNMRIFYEQWCEYIIRQPMADELQQPDLQEDINRQPTAGEMQLAVYYLIASKIRNFSHPAHVLYGMTWLLAAVSQRWCPIAEKPKLKICEKHERQPSNEGCLSYSG